MEKSLLHKIKYLLDPEWCAFGVDESKASPEVFAGEIEFSYQLKCMTPCKNIIHLSSVGTYTCKWYSGQNHQGIRIRA
jgi:hypothetical protein